MPAKANGIIYFFSGIVAFFIINKGHNDLILREILSLENGDGFELILSYHDENDIQMTNTQIKKSVYRVKDTLLYNGAIVD